MAEALVIASEDDLWSLLERMLSGSPYNPELEVFLVQGWRPELLYFPDEPLGHTITPSIAKGITGFHNSLAKGYASLAYGKPDSRKLKADDIEALDIRILVVAGSDGLEVNDDAMAKLIKCLVAKMTGNQVTIAIIALILLYFSATVAKNWISEEHEAKRRKDEGSERIAMSEQETARIKIITEALTRSPELKPIAELADQGREPLVRSALTSENTRVMGTALTRDQAIIIISSTKNEGRGQRIDGEFEVVEIDVDNPEGFMGTLKRVSSGDEFRVSINRGEIPNDDIEALFAALRDKGSVNALVNAWFIGDKLSSAVVVRADKKP